MWTCPQVDISRSFGLGGRSGAPKSSLGRADGPQYESQPPHLPLLGPEVDHQPPVCPKTTDNRPAPQVVSEANSQTADKESLRFKV